jgi:hypothetical protein
MKDRFGFAVIRHTTDYFIIMYKDKVDFDTE